jgi:hypothetical protein
MIVVLTQNKTVGADREQRCEPFYPFEVPL